MSQNESNNLSPHENLLDPDAIPNMAMRGAGKRLNNLSLIIGAVLLGAFLIFIFWVMYDKANTPAMFAGSEENKAESSTVMADKLTAGIHDSLIMPEEPAQPKQDTLIDVNSLPTMPQQQAQIQIPVATRDSGPPLPPRLTEEEMRVRQMKIQMFEQALLGKTGVSVQGFQDSKKAAASSQSGTQTEREMLAQHISATRTRLAQMQASGGGADPTTAYMERLTALRSGESGDIATNTGGATQLVAAASTPSNPFQGTQQQGADRWLLPNQTGGTVTSAPRTAYELRTGTVIPAAMDSGINSDLPGQILGHTTQDVYDTATGHHLVIPQGTKLIGMYNNEVKFGQERVLIVWQRLIYPDGRALDLGSMPGADGAGYAGFKDKVETHFWRAVGGALLMSGVIAGVNLSQDNRSSGDSQRASDALSESLGQTLGQTLAQMLNKYMNVSPTIEIRPGYRFNVIVTKDIPFTQAYQSFNY